ncbi:MAG TPA: DUF4902 domain-containing protein [Paucimonas sp.]|nr:DUF4902 domain-containing protein [Paucimonas sp.]
MHQPIVSHDGYIRLSLRNLSEIPFVHLASDLDTGILEELQMQTVPAQTAGYSEWISNTTPAISLGWSWFVHSDSRRLLPAPEAVRSNVMLIDARGYDLGPTATSFLFTTWLATHDWEHAVSEAVDISSS